MLRKAKYSVPLHGRIHVPPLTRLVEVLFQPV